MPCETWTVRASADDLSELQATLNELVAAEPGFEVVGPTPVEDDPDGSMGQFPWSELMISVAGGVIGTASYELTKTAIRDFISKYRGRSQLTETPVPRGQQDEL